MYMAVTADEYELPLVVASNAQELADKLNTTIGNVYSTASKGMSGKRNGYKIVRVRDEDELGGQAIKKA